MLCSSSTTSCHRKVPFAQTKGTFCIVCSLRPPAFHCESGFDATPACAASLSTNPSSIQFCLSAPQLRPIIPIHHLDCNRISSWIPSILDGTSPSQEPGSAPSDLHMRPEARSCYRLSIATAVARAISIIWRNEVRRSRAGSFSPVTRLSEMVQMANARRPASAALQ